ncbi:MAG: DUF927 domain-containing protein [Candidatus Marinimicrobia bacterium]|nr:DUF927 domain-containing protein [Candidatus Neomarinimicrobiota bacterium]
MDKKLFKKIETVYRSGTSQVDCANLINEMNLSGDEEEQALNYIHEVYAQEQPIYDDEDEKIYFLQNNRIYWHRQTREGPLSSPLCDFICHIAEKVTKDNGKDITLWFRISGTDEHGDPLPIIDIKTKDFPSMSWVVTSEWALRATISPGQNIKERLQHAIQLLSKGAPSRLVYRHTGWREIDGQHVFLTAGGAIGPDPKQEINVNVELDLPLQGYVLLPPLGDPVEAFNASRDFLNIGELPVTLPIWTAMYLAPLSDFIDTAFTMWYVASSGSFKSVLSALALSHFGDFTDRNLPANWMSTKNSLEKLLFLAKNTPLVIDDWYPGETANDSKRLAQTAGDIIRAQGNRQGRGRMNGDLDVQSGYYPRGLLISSGEMLPGGHSQIARVIVVNMEKGDIDREKLTEAQGTYSRRCYNMAMSHYISWISRNWERLSKELPKKWNDFREVAYKNEQHARLASDIASLNTALYAVIEFGKELGCIDDADEQLLIDSGNDIFGQIVAQQGDLVEDERPSIKFKKAISALLAAGKIQFDSKDDDDPMPPKPGTDWVGWHDGNGTLFFDQENTFTSISKYYQSSGRHLGFNPRSLWADLRLQNISFDHQRKNNKLSPTAKVKINGISRSVIKVKRDFFAD